MKLNIANAPYIDRSTGEFVEGRIKVFLHNTNIYAELYTLEGSSYVAAPNPQLLHAGLPEDTLFTDIGLYDISVEKYIGPEGHMSVESPDSDFSNIDEFETGIDFDLNAFNANRVNTMDDLRDADPSLGFVTVNWYAEPGDCVPRTYIWDAASVNSEDGGYVVSSDISDTGRWILFWDDEVLPACVYGVKPGEESNMNLLLNYPSVVGSFLMATAPCVRFQNGTYTSDTTYSTSKELCFDAGAKFTRALFQCPSIRLFGANTSYIADFSFSSDNVEAHSSWFRDVNTFWHCGAHKYIVDETNYFTSNVLRTAAGLQYKVIEGAHRIDVTYASGAYLQISYCTLNANRLFSPRYDRIKFQGMTIDQSWFMPAGIGYWDFGSIASHNIEATTTNANVIDFSRFTTPDVYLKACLANGDTTFDGHGATYSAYANNSQFATISNCVFSSAFTDSECYDWKNVSLNGGITFTGAGRTINMEGCSLGLNNNTGALSNIYLKDCDVAYTGNAWCPNDTVLHVVGGTFAGRVELSSAAKSAYTRNKSLVFDGCTVTSTSMWINDITMRNCVCTSHIYLVPFAEDSRFKHNCEFVNNRFIGGFLLEIKPKDMSTETSVFNVLCTLKLRNNAFNQSDARGIVMPYVTNTFDFNKMYVDNASNPLCEYKGNFGNCPAENPTRTFLSDTLTQTYSTGPTASDIKYQPPTGWKQRVWNMSPNIYYQCGYGWQCEPGESWNRYTGRNAEMHEGIMLHIGRVTLTEEMDDQFAVVHAWLENDDYDDDRMVMYPW